MALIVQKLVGLGDWEEDGVGLIEDFTQSEDIVPAHDQLPLWTMSFALDRSAQHILPPCSGLSLICMAMLLIGESSEGFQTAFLMRKHSSTQPRGCLTKSNIMMSSDHHPSTLQADDHRRHLLVPMEECYGGVNWN